MDSEYFSYEHTGLETRIFFINFEKISEMLQFKNSAVSSYDCHGQWEKIRKINKKNHTENLYRSHENLKPNDMSAFFYNKPAQMPLKQWDVCMK